MTERDVKAGIESAEAMAERFYNELGRNEWAAAIEARDKAVAIAVLYEVPLRRQTMMERNELISRIKSGEWKP